MFFLRKSILTLTAFIILPFCLWGQKLPTIEQKADSLYDNYQDKQALELYSTILDENPNNYFALWRTSFLYSRVGNRLGDEDKKKEYFKKAIAHAEQSLEVDSTDTQSNFVMSVAMGRKAIISGARERVASSREIKKYADRAIKYDSTNAGAWHVLGRWNFKVANLSWIERTAANTLFGGIPGNASNQKAAEFIEKAILINDAYVLYYYDLAKVYDEQGRDQQAISTCQQALELPNLTPDDNSIKEDCRELIENLR